MIDAPRIETERLILRAIDGERDFEAFAAMYADEVVMTFIGGVQERAMAWRSMCGAIGQWPVRGYGFFAVEEKATGAFVGRVGPHFPEGWPAPEVAWTIARSRWGRGYAVEAAAASLDWAFDRLGWREAIHLIDAANTASRRVAEKLGSRRTGEIKNLRPFGLDADIWSQTAEDWRAGRGGARSLEAHPRDRV